MVEKHGIAYHEKGDGELFCDSSSKDILAMLTTECAQANVRILTECEIRSVEKNRRFRVATGDDIFVAESLVIATGGLSIPKMGASDFGYRLARQFDLNVRETRAGLVPFTFSGAMQRMTERLSGVSTRATINSGGRAFTGNILFTHRGLSGPAALKSSSYWTQGSEIRLDLLPEPSTSAFLLTAKNEQPKAVLRTVLSDALPRALVLELQRLFWESSTERALAGYADADLQRIETELHDWALKPSGTEGYRTAEVTLGGIDTDELSSKTMASKNVPGLYCIGEVTDVTGDLGGFNFQWAWSSAQAAGKVV